MSQEKNALGVRMKSQYEVRAQTLLPRRTYTILRLDGRAFHTYTRNLQRPFDWRFMEDMNETARYLCENVQGCKFAYAQSDEISLVLTDFDEIGTQAWFDGNVQKMVSVSASLATAMFNARRLQSSIYNPLASTKLAEFDSRVFTIPDPIEVMNYFIWRQKDCVRNSVSAAGQEYCSQSALSGVPSDEIKWMLWSDQAVNWEDYDPRFKYGSVVLRDREIPGPWRAEPATLFTEDRTLFSDMLPGWEEAMNR